MLSDKERRQLEEIEKALTTQGGPLVDSLRSFGRNGRRESDNGGAWFCGFLAVVLLCFAILAAPIPGTTAHVVCALLATGTIVFAVLSWICASGRNKLLPRKSWQLRRSNADV